MSKNPPPKKHGPNLRRDGTRVFEDGSFENRRTGEGGGDRSMPWTDTTTGKVYPSRGQEAQQRVARTKDDALAPGAQRSFHEQLQRKAASRNRVGGQQIRIAKSKDREHGESGSAKKEAAKRMLDGFRRGR